MKVTRNEVHKVRDKIVWDPKELPSVSVRNARAVITNGDLKSFTFRMKDKSGGDGYWRSFALYDVDTVKSLYVITGELLKFLNDKHKVVLSKEGESFELENKFKRHLRIAKESI